MLSRNAALEIVSEVCFQRWPQFCSLTLTTYTLGAGFILRSQILTLEGDHFNSALRASIRVKVGSFEILFTYRKRRKYWFEFVDIVSVSNDFISIEITNARFCPIHSSFHFSADTSGSKKVNHCVLLWESRLTASRGERERFGR